MDNSSVLPHGYVLRGAEQSYVIDRVLGQGSFGITYLAKYKTQITGQMGRGSGWTQVCVKEFFMREASNLAHAHHSRNQGAEGQLYGCMDHPERREGLQGDQQEERQLHIPPCRWQSL